MVLTLIKHEVRRTWKLLLAVIAVPLVVALLMAILVLLDLPVVSTAALFLGTMAATLMVAGVQILLIWDYWRSSYSAAGYLTHSLPVSGRTIFAVKFTWACLVLAVAAVGTLLLIGLLTLAGSIQAGMTAGAYFAILGDVWSQATAVTPAWLWIAGAVFLIASVALSLIKFYSAISFGYESPLARLGHAGPVVVYLVMSMVLQVVFFLGFVVVPFGLDFTSGPSIEPLPLTQLIASTNSEVMPLGFVPVILLVTIALVWRTSTSWQSRISLR